MTLVVVVCGVSHYYRGERVRTLMCGVRKYGMTKMTGVSEAWQMLHEGTFVFKMLILRPWYNKSMTLYVLLLRIRGLITSASWQLLSAHACRIVQAIEACIAFR